MTEQNEKQSGSAILFVLWASVLVSVLLVGIVSLSQNQLRMAGSIRDRARDVTILRSALELAAYDVATIGRSAIQDFPRELAVQGHRVQVSLNPVGQRLDINLADEDSLRDFLIRSGQDAINAERLARRILDWRDNDDRARVNGAERGDYPDGWANPPANRPFRSVGEMAGVLGMSPALLECLSPHLTVFGSSPSPLNDSLVYDTSASASGIRISLGARIVERERPGPELVGLALFGHDRMRPFQWVAFSSERSHAANCSQQEL